MIILVLVRNEGRSIIDTLKKWRSTTTFLFTSLLLVVNWMVYIWAVNSGHIVDSSLGYFINPLVNVCFGVVFLKERLRFWQWVAIFIAFVGVLYLSLGLGSVPWIGLTLAMTFGLYGLIRKRVEAKSTHGFTLEMGLMFIPAVIYLLVLEVGGWGSLNSIQPADALLLVMTGLVTAVPLVLFGAAVRFLTLTTLGFIQYIAPTLQFLIGIVVFNEDFSAGKLVGYGIIWLALAVFSIEGVFANQGKKKNQRGVPAL
jgi:chloramphenicol-sensitive protein RarD